MRSRSNSHIIWTCLAALALGCPKSNEGAELGTNTNWLKTCDEQAPCGSKDACVCGVCTRACDDDSACRAVHAETRCQAPSTNACGELHQAPASACLQACASDGDCSALERGRCVDGLCVPAPAASEGGSEPSAPSYELWRIDDEVVVTDAYTSCETDRDCVLVSKSCNACCQLAAIDPDLAEIFDAARGPACVGYQGGSCDCDFPDVLARCQAGRCRAVPRDKGTCYSPSQNFESAYSDGALGCRCRDGEGEICVGRAALVCRRENEFLLSWSAVEDGPCGEAAGDLDKTCARGERRQTAQACVTAHESCYQLPDGDFCGLR